MDSELRRREREALQEDDPVARSRVIAARLRAGRLRLEDVRLAAHAGDLAARFVAGHPGCAVCEERGALPGEMVGRPGEDVPCQITCGFEAWCAGLERLVAPARAGSLERAVGAALAHAVLVQGDAPATVEAVVAWSECPCERHAEAVRSALALARRGALVGEREQLALGALERPLPALVAIARTLSSEEAVRGAVIDAFGPWLLGEAARVEAAPLGRLASLATLGGQEPIDAERLAALRVWADGVVAGAAREAARHESSQVRRDAVREAIAKVVDERLGDRAHHEAALAHGGSARSEYSRWWVTVLVVRRGERITVGAAPSTAKRLHDAGTSWKELGRWGSISDATREARLDAWADVEGPDRFQAPLAVARAFVDAGD